MTDTLAAADPRRLAERVVLGDDDGAPSGEADTATVHTADTPLHLAFSCHLVGPDGRVLVTRRALTKRTFAGVWSNAFCGHPAPGERMEEAIVRRGRRELGVELGELDLVLPDFRYRAVDASGVVENEICPVFVARIAGDPHPAADEVDDWWWSDAAELRRAVEAAPFAFSPWLGWQFAQWPDAQWPPALG
jgi:isopentenyl-diphosphate Delta-isomerase